MSEAAPEPADVPGRCLERADQLLANARRMVAEEMPDEAGRNAYLATFHAARAVVARALSVDDASTVAKSHSGLQTIFHQLVGRGSEEGQRSAAALNRLYALKQTHDYALDPPPLSADDAGAAIAEAEAAVAFCRREVAAPSPALLAAAAAVQASRRLRPAAQPSPTTPARPRGGRGRDQGM